MRCRGCAPVRGTLRAHSGAQKRDVRVVVVRCGRLLAGSYDSNIYVWELPTYKRIHTLNGLFAKMDCVEAVVGSVPVDSTPGDVDNARRVAPFPGLSIHGSLVLWLNMIYAGPKAAGSIAAPGEKAKLLNRSPGAPHQGLPFRKHSLLSLLQKYTHT